MPQHVPPLRLAPDAAVDLQLHTTFSDGEWSAEGLLAHVAAELSTEWERQMLDLLCYGFDPAQPSPLATIAATTYQEQIDNYREVYGELQRRGYRFPGASDILGPGNDTPRRLQDLIALLERHGYGVGMGDALRGAGFRWITADPAAIVEAAHSSGAVCLIGHPGRGDGFVRMDEAQLDRFRASVPIDGLEVEHPSHTPEQVEMFREYARRQGLLMSTGSDSHGPLGQLPIKYPAEASRALLERVGIRMG